MLLDTPTCHYFSNGVHINKFENYIYNSVLQYLKTNWRLFRVPLAPKYKKKRYYEK